MLVEKLPFFLVNTTALVDQHAKCLESRTNFNVGRYSGDMNLDFWPRSKWCEEFNKYQVLIMTIQILVNIVNENHLDLNKVNLLIFDECHRGVSDQPMRQLCKAFENLKDPPRVLGLTATLLNGNCKPSKVMEEVRNLEITFHAKVAAAEGLDHVVCFSTNPSEKITYFQPHFITTVEESIAVVVNELKSFLAAVKIEPLSVSLPLAGLKPLVKKEGLKKLINNMQDLIEHVRMLGIYGGSKGVLAHMIQIEALRKHCSDVGLAKLFTYVQVVLLYLKSELDKAMKGYSEKERFYRFSSDKVLKLTEILTEYKRNATEDMCGLIFTQKRFTAKILYHVLEALSQCDPDFSYIKPNFIVGSQNNPYNNSRESLYIAKKNREILQLFENKEINMLVASNVLEEGVDIPRCTMVVKFDKPLDYRSYIQSKGRARHKSSWFYMMVETKDAKTYADRYMEFQEVESILTKYLVGKNDLRSEPTDQDIVGLYREDEIEPYYTNGPDSARITVQSAIPLLNCYCSSLPHDMYTVINPQYYYQEEIICGKKQISVTIWMPMLCPIVEPIRGPFMTSMKSAKRSVAMETCIRLHKCGEFDDHLVPKSRNIREEDVGFLFKHYPAEKEPKAGFSGNKRIHNNEIPKCINVPITSTTPCYLHIISLSPTFANNLHSINVSTMYDVYSSQLCYGLLTPNSIPNLCQFPIYVSVGTINVSIQTNVRTVNLSEIDIDNVKEFNVTVYADVIKVLRPFLIFDTSGKAGTMMLVPVDRRKNDIDYSVLNAKIGVKNIYELTSEEKMKMEVTLDDYLNKIVSPWYRESNTYIITEITFSKNPESPFPNEEFSSFVEYFKCKYGVSILNKTQPMLLVKGITKRMNFFKSQGEKRKHDKTYDETLEYMVPELVVKQDFPSSLWVQASFLPTILTRMVYMLRLVELRSKIVAEANLGTDTVPNKPLEFDNYLSNFTPYEKQVKERNVLVDDIKDNSTVDISSLKLIADRNYAHKMLEAEYPWKDKDEPKDIERFLDVTAMDIEYYEMFINERVNDKDRHRVDNKKFATTNALAITYPNSCNPKSIAILKQINKQGPDLSQFYAAFAAVHANDIVNLERLETLGDSFLKYISSVFISMRFPKFDEGQATNLKGRLVSNKNLYYLAATKNFGGIMRYYDLTVSDWVPPCFKIPDFVVEHTRQGKIPYTSVFNLNTTFEEQISGKLDDETVKVFLNDQTNMEPEKDEEIGTVAPFFGGCYVGDKHVADTVEAAIGCYLENCGLEGATKFVEWIGIIPSSENIRKLLAQPAPNPIVGMRTDKCEIDYHIPDWQNIEKSLGYHFKNRAYLLQALTHASYVPNRLTQSYEKLEFLGDAILDFLITCHIYETCGKLSPGDLTDLRSALVNNNTFASLAVRCNFHKSLLMINSKLQSYVDRFADYITSKNFEVDDEVLILLDEDDMSNSGMKLAEYVDVPKVLGDIFEAIAGAVYLDSGKDLAMVWNVIYKIMWKEINLFSANVPKNVIRRLYEWIPSTYPVFGPPINAGRGMSMIQLEFRLDGHIQRVYGFGSNKTLAKKAAAKLALRSLSKS